jgi:hypothetical protein
LDSNTSHQFNRSRELIMYQIKATCQTEGCQQKGITHEFKSPITNTACGVCSQEVTDLIIEEVTDGTNEEAE